MSIWKRLMGIEEFGEDEPIPDMAILLHNIEDKQED